MAATKTKAEPVDPAAYLEQVEPAQRRADGKVLAAMMERVSGCPPVMWGPSILGFDRYHYRYDSGHEGDMCRIGFAPRKAELVLYVLGDVPDQEALLARLGKHRTGKGCLYVKTLADVDSSVLEELVAASLAANRERWPG